MSGLIGVLAITLDQYVHPKGICLGIVCGDTKLNWDVQKAISAGK